jgi:hydrogenase maturation protease
VSILAGEYRGRSDVTCLDGGTLSFTLAGPIADHGSLIVIDAARFGGAPGAVRRFEGQDMDLYLRGVRKSAHEVGLVDLLDLARLSETLPPRRALVGVEPEILGWGDSPGEAVRLALPRVVEEVQGLLDRWSREGGTTNRRAG